MSDTTKNGTLVTGAVQLGYDDNTGVLAKFEQASNQNGRMQGVSISQFGTTIARVNANGINVIEPLKVKRGDEFLDVATVADIQKELIPFDAKLAKISETVAENLKEEEEDIAELTGTVAALKSDFDKYAKIEAEERFDELEKAVAANHTDIADLKNADIAIKGDIESHAAILASMENEQDELEAKVAGDIAAFGKSIDEMKESTSALFIANAEQDDKIADLSKKIIAVEGKTKANGEEITRVENALRIDMGNISRSLSTVNGELVKGLSTINNEIVKTNTALNSHIGDFDSVKQDIKNLGKQQDVEKQELIELANKFDGLKGSVNSAISGHKAEILEISERVQDNENEIIKINTALGTNNKAVTDLGATAENIKRDLAAMNTRVSQNTKAIDELQDDLYHLKSSVTDQLAQSIGLTATVNGTLSQFETRIVGVEKVVEVAKEAGESVVAISAKVEDLSKVLDERTDTINHMVEDNVKVLVEAIHNCEDYNKAQDERLDALEAGNAEQTKQITDLQNASVNLLAHLTECGKAIKAGEAKNAEQDARLDALEGADGQFGERIDAKFAELETMDANQQILINNLAAADAVLVEAIHNVEKVAQDNAAEIARVNGELVNTNTVLGQVAENLAGVNTALVKEIEDRKAADDAFDDRMDKYADNVLSIQREIHDAFGKIESEQVAREEADKALSDAIAAEKTARQETDAALNQTIVDSVNNINEMVAGQVATIVTAIQTNAGAINQEIADRKAADSSIRADVNVAIEQVAAGLQSQINALHMVGDPGALQDLAKTVEAINANKDLITSNAALIAENKTAIAKNAEDIAALAEKQAADASAASERMDALEAKDVELEAKDAALDSAVKTIQSNNVKRDQRIAALEEELTKVDVAAMTDLKVRMAVAETTLAAVDARSQECMTSCTAFKSEVKAHMGEYERVADDLKATTDEHIAKAEDRLDDHLERIARLEALMGAGYDVQEMIAALKEDLEKAEELNEKQSELIEEQEKINEEQAEKIEEQDKKIAKLNATVYALLAGLKDAGLIVGDIEISDLTGSEIVEGEDGEPETKETFDDIPLGG